MDATPVFDIEIVTPSGDRLAPGLSGELSNVLGRAMGSGPGTVWVRLRTRVPEAGAEHMISADRPAPVFVTLTASSLPEGRLIERVVQQLTRIIARVTRRRPGDVHIVVQPAEKIRGATLREARR